MLKKDQIVNQRWRIVNRLTNNSGQGQTWEVTDTYDPKSAELYIMKVLKKQDEKSIERFRNEIDAAIKLKHPNIVNHIDSKLENTPTPYLVTEYCEGGELNAEFIQDLSIGARLRLFRVICEAVAFAHAQGISHRDLKPRNIFINNLVQQIPVIGDFGLCFFHESLDEEGRVTELFEKVGASNFRPPEGDIGRVQDMKPSFDVYSLGKLLYWFISDGGLVTREYYSQPPFDLRVENQNQWIHQAHEIFDRSIKETPTDRYKDAGAMLEDVDKLIDFVEKNARYLDCGIPQPCVFCRNGTYDFFHDPDSVTRLADAMVLNRCLMTVIACTMHKRMLAGIQVFLLGAATNAEIFRTFE